MRTLSGRASTIGDTGTRTSGRACGGSERRLGSSREESLPFRAVLRRAQALACERGRNGVESSGGCPSGQCYAEHRPRPVNEGGAAWKVVVAALQGSATPSTGLGL